MNDEAADNRPSIRTRVAGAVFTITLSNPARMNALTRSMWEAIPVAIKAAEDDPHVRVVVLEGDGTRAFSAGADISEFDAHRSGDAAQTYDALNSAAFAAVAECARPTIAKIAGFCMGGGMQLALSCDLRVVAEDAMFAIPAARLGLGYNPRWFATILSVLGPAQVKDVIFTGRRFGAAEAQAFGLVSRLASPEALDETARTLAEEIAANAPLTMLAAKRAIDAHSRIAPAEMEALREMADACFRSEDYAEGRAAFAEKRKPVFRGR